MKQDIHPKWFENSKIVCACGNSFITGSTQEEIRVEICSACHPFFTGQQKFVDSLGRVEKFQKKQAAAPKKQPISRRNKKILKKSGEEEKELKSLKEMLSQKS